MKKQWMNPEMANLAVEATQNPETLDLGHGYDDVNHKHHCICGMTFATWAEAMAHERAMTDAGLNAEHNIGCTILS